VVGERDRCCKNLFIHGDPIKTARSYDSVVVIMRQHKDKVNSGSDSADFHWIFNLSVLSNWLISPAALG
jgi:hypothetical protein